MLFRAKRSDHHLLTLSSILWLALAAGSACQRATVDLGARGSIDERSCAIASLTEKIESAAPRVWADLDSGEFGKRTDLELLCEDDTACAAISYTLDGSEPDFAGNGVFAETVNRGRASAHLTLGAVNDGIFVVRFRGRDLWGNVSGVAERRITVDKRAPRIRISAPELSASDSTPISFECSDSGSGCREIAYTLDGSPPSFETPPASQQTVPGFAGTRRITASGLHVIQAIARDAVGHVSRKAAVRLEIDRAAPTVSMTPAAGNFRGSVELKLDCSDVGTGCATALVTTDGSTPMAGAPRTRMIGSFPASLHLTSSATVRVVVKDRAGNVSPERQASYVVRGYELARSR